VLAGSVAAVDVLIPVTDLTAGRGVTTHGGQWLSGAAVGRLACDANITRSRVPSLEQPSASRVSVGHSAGEKRALGGAKPPSPSRSAGQQAA